MRSLTATKKSSYSPLERRGKGNKTKKSSYSPLERRGKRNKKKLV
ncbi:hypothetical protein BN871_KB_00010 [Paenibacillus sp. P22]|nr:hypothetical protein BN871_KB_00010 [Paenibacillus sp. P22]